MKLCQDRIDEQIRNRTIIENIPTDKLLKITTVWGDDTEETIAEVITFNKDSIRCTIIAAKIWENAAQEAIAFSSIRKWEVFPIEDLPLLVSWAVKHPIYTALIRNL